MCYHPKHIKVRQKRPSLAFPEQFIELDVPCGRCVQCLKRKQNDYMVRLLRECQNGQKMWFITLTYNNASLPIAKNFYRVDVESGEVERMQCCEVMKRNLRVSLSDSEEELRSEILKQKAGSLARYYRHYICDSNNKPIVIDGYQYYVDLTPSLYREDVKNWIKGCRVQYERNHDKSLPIRYAWCGEYGGNRSRPHYHMILLNVEKDVVSWMLKRWKYGFTYVKEVPMYNSDGTNARQIAAKYIGKYVSKGKFDVDSVVNCDAQRGRLCNSKRFGTYEFKDSEVSYFRAYDLFGKYDINFFTFENGIKLSSSQQDSVVKEVFERMKYPVNYGDKFYSICLPKSLRVYLFYNHCRLYDEKEKKFKKVYRASVLSRKVMDYAQSLASERDERKYKLFLTENGFSEDSKMLAEYDDYKEFVGCDFGEKYEEFEFSFKLCSSQKDGQ